MTEDELRDELFAEAAAELDGNGRDEGLWAKCFVECDGDENKAKALYMKNWVARKIERRERLIDEFAERRTHVVEMLSDSRQTADTEDEPMPDKVERSWKTRSRSPALFFGFLVFVIVLVLIVGNVSDVADDVDPALSINNSGGFNSGDFSGVYMSPDRQYSLTFRQDGKVEAIGKGYGAASDYQVLGNELVVKNAKWAGFRHTKQGERFKDSLDRYADEMGSVVIPVDGNGEIFRIDSLQRLVWIATNGDRSRLSKDFIVFEKVE